MQQVEYNTLIELMKRTRLNLVLLTSTHCQFCQQLKSELPKVDLKGIPIYNIEMTDPENKQLAEEILPDTIPFIAVYDNGIFQGGDSLGIEGIQALVNALTEKQENE